ncbi:MAG: UPF0182 family protein [Thermoanaerobaculia bacterium]
MSSSAEVIEGGKTYPAPAAEFPPVALPSAPPAALLWSRVLTVASVLVTLFTLDQLTYLLGDLWLLRGLGLESVFWTNFRMGAKLYVGAFLLFGVAVAVPAFLHPVGRVARRKILQAAFLIASVAALIAALRYHEFLLGSTDVRFGKTDPVFGIDLGFYMFNLPNIWIAWRFLMVAALLFLVSSIACASSVRRAAASSSGRIAGWLGRIASPATRAAIVLCGLIAAAGVWLSRYGLLFKDNSDSSVKRGAEYLDVTGLFSNLNYISVTTVIVLALTAGLVVMLSHLDRAASGRAAPDWRRRLRRVAAVALLLVAADFAFKGIVVLRDVVAVRPNEPVVQLPFIARHVDATRQAYGLDKVQEIEFVPNGPGDPMPAADALLSSPTLKNAPLWPGFTSYLERWLDKQHAQRIVQTQGNHMVYGPTLELFQQQQKLRTYYNFLGVDSVRYPINGETRMFVSSVRETPLYEPVPWLAYWGQRFMLFTHGFGLVMAPTAETNANGEPHFVSREIPIQADWPEISVRNPRVYYGEGSATMAFSNVDRMKELDYPTDQDRAEMVLPPEVPAGVPVDSFLKRLVFGWRSGKFFQLVFSDLIKETTRVHYYRTPLDRLDRVAPFLFFDSNPYAVSADGQLLWIVNAMTTSDGYPYSFPEEMGDKSDERSAFPRPERMVNYVEDSVKATVDAYTGQVRLYTISSSPVIAAWSKIYPDLFVPESKMPEGVRRQLTYPTQLFHVQFDDLYIYYHMKDPMYFFNMEDMWDDGDEVLGPIMDTGKAITFSIEPYSWLAETGGSLPPSGRPVQYALSMAFTPEKALNLRSIPIAYQDPPDYGKLSVLQIPKGRYVIGPEQADAAIDQDPTISQNFSWWNRRGTEGIRGHTALLVVGNEILYVEPIFLRSQQNPVPQLKKVVVVFRGRPVMADTLEAAVRLAVAEEKPVLTAAARAASESE